MKILVTGATGFIGRHLIPELLKEKHRILILQRRKSDISYFKQYKNRLQFFDFEGINLEKLLKKQRVDIIIHLAGEYIKREPTDKEARKIANFNVTKSSLLLKAAVNNKVKGFVNTGTFFEFKPTDKSLSETSEKLPFNYYAASKMAFEDILKNYVLHNKIRAVTLRLFSPYGETQINKIIPSIINSFINNKKLLLTKGDQKLSFTYIGDVVRAYIKAIKFITSKKYKKYEDFNIGANETLSISQVVKKIRNLSNKTAPLKFGTIPYFEQDYKIVKCNSKKAKKILGWYPKTSIDQGLRKTYNYSAGL